MHLNLSPLSIILSISLPHLPQLVFLIYYIY